MHNANKTPKAELFDLAGSIDAHKDSMVRSREDAVAGVPIRMTSRVTQMEAPHYFVDEQAKGPFRSLRHVHEFSQDSAGSTMVDRIAFTAPFGPVGRLVEKLVWPATSRCGVRRSKDAEVVKK